MFFGSKPLLVFSISKKALHKAAILAWGIYWTVDFPWQGDARGSGRENSEQGPMWSRQTLSFLQAVYSPVMYVGKEKAWGHLEIKWIYISVKGDWKKMYIICICFLGSLCLQRSQQLLM